MAAGKLALLAVAASAAASAQAVSVAVNFSALGQSYDGVGALSGGGGVTRMLIDYPQHLQEDLLDILFTPNKGASLQYIKVEIGGDSQSTEGTEPSHAHFRGDLNCTRGYEWGILAAAKARNPAIKTYGLSWAVPGWIGNGQFFSQENIDYHLSWLQCAQDVWQIPIDYLGIWNERYSGSEQEFAYIKSLRSALDKAGYHSTRIVSADTKWDITEAMIADPELAAAIDVVGVHYPSNVDPNAYTLQAQGKGLWASEMWDLSKVDDWDGALSLANNIGQHGVWGLSASIVWCLIYSWYAILPFSRVVDGSVAGAGHSLLTAAEPWSGHYELNPTIAAVAHTTQFAQPGWTYLASGSGSGYLDSSNSSTMVTIVNTRVPAGVLEFSCVFETYKARGGAPITVTLQLGGIANGAPLPSTLHLWATLNASYTFQQQADVPVSSDGSVTLVLQPQAIYSLTTTTGQGGPSPANAIPDSAPFPYPYSDSFDSYAEGAYPKYTADEGGIFVVEPIPAELATPQASAALPAAAVGAAAAAASGSALYQVVRQIPIAWETNPAPYTLLGNFNGGVGAWTNYTVSVNAALDPSVGPAPGVEYFTDMQPCNGGSGQKWKLQGGGDLSTPTFLESTAQPGLCLGVDGAYGQLENAAAVALVNCSQTTGGQGGAAAPWLSQPPYIVNTATGQCLNVGGNNQSAGALGVTWPCLPLPSGSNEVFNATLSSSGGDVYATLSSPFDGGMCLDIFPVSKPQPYVTLCSRINTYQRQGPPPSGYCLSLFASQNSTTAGTWQLAFAKTVLAQGSTPGPIIPGAWHALSVTASGETVTASLDGTPLPGATVAGSKLSSYGMVALGSGWHSAWFDDLSIQQQ